MTREDAILCLKGIKNYGRDTFTSKSQGDWQESLDMAIKALEQEPVLDKIREEILNTIYVDSLIFGELIDFKNGKIDADDVIEEFNRVTRMEVLRIIDKYRAESEEEK